MFKKIFFILILFLFVVFSLILLEDGITGMAVVGTQDLDKTKEDFIYQMGLAGIILLIALLQMINIMLTKD